MTYQELMAQAKGKAEEATALLSQEKPEQEKAAALLAEAKGLQERAAGIKAASSIIEAATKVERPELPTDSDEPPMNTEPTARDAAIKALYSLRFGEPDSAIIPAATPTEAVDKALEAAARRVSTEAAT